MAYRAVNEGAAGVDMGRNVLQAECPSAMLLVMVTAFGLPTEIVGIIAAFYRLFDMGTTTNNCLGDLAGTVFVSKLEDKAAARAKSA